MYDKNTTIKIIGDSLAAGAGSSLFHETDEIVIEDDGKKYFRCVSKNSWWGLLEEHLSCMIKNNGCCGAFSYQIYNHLDELVAKEDQIVFLLMGVNDRKRIDGMNELRFYLEKTINKLQEMGKHVSVHSIESGCSFNYFIS